MRELSLHLLDLARNSIEAGATLLELTVVEDPRTDTLKIVLRDNGAGMDEQAVARATDAFYTTRTTRRWGLGLALFKATCEAAQGQLEVASRPGEGTVVSATLRLGHLDRPPLGNMGALLQALVCEADRLALRYRHRVGDREFYLDTEELRRELGGICLTEPVVLQWLAGHVNAELRTLGSRA
ncbi:MAG: ATP-binding protein [Armatimonadota bacterium]